MIARRAIWSDPKVRALLTRFVPATDEVGRLQRIDDPEAILFRKVAEQGHYAGRSQPSSTRQGLYATTVDGRMLGSMNHNDPARVAAMLEKAWAAWEALPEAERVPAAGWDGHTGRKRIEDRYPVGGLALRVTSRDLERSGSAGAGASRAGGDWRQTSWNMDYAWFRPEELSAFIPTPLAVGSTREIPAPLAERFVRLHLVDNVRGQTYPVKHDELTKARLTVRIAAIDGTALTLDLEGEGHYAAEGSWPIGGLRGEATTQRRGYEGHLLGHATYDTARARFTAFELLAVGSRWGATQYNGRHDDLEAAPIGHLFELAGDAPHERIAPASWWEYGWR